MSRLSIFFGVIFSLVSCSVSSIKYGLNNIKLPEGEIVYVVERGSSAADTLLLAFQGSDCNSIAHDQFLEVIRSSFQELDRVFIEKSGITPSLEYDSNPERKDCPKQYLEKDNPEKRAEDAIVVIRKVQSERRYKNIVVLGGSEGGLVSVIVAAKSQEVSAVITLNGGGARFIDDVLHNIRATSPPEKLEEDLSGIKGFAAHIANSEPTQLDVSNHGFSWWHVVLGLDQSNYLKQIKVPVLVIQAENDKSVSPTHAIEMVNSLRGLGYENIELITYSNLDHTLTDEDGESHVSKVLEDSKIWLNSLLVTKP